MRIALIYDCLYPNTIGGAERWYRNLAERLGETHEVTYVTRRQWGEEGPETDFETIAVAPGGNLYTASGRRRLGPPLRFGWGVFRHLLRHGGRYDAVHTASFPYFSVLAAAAALRLRRSNAALIVDWHELWTNEYWRSYLGSLAGRVGSAVQALCLRLPDRSFTFSRLVERRLGELGHRAPLVRLTGEYAGDPPALGPSLPEPADPPLVVFAGRHVPEKHVLDIAPAIAVARQEIPNLRCAILGEGPQTQTLRGQVRRLGLDGVIEIPGRVDPDRVESTIATASCLLNPSEREGYGLVVVEAAARGTPSIVVAGPENAATELIEPGVNGFIATSRDPVELAEAIAAAVEAGELLRIATLDWFDSHRKELSISSSLELVAATYATRLLVDK
jgi:glycosyltransferase involved in cell wall biosynthesis